MIGIFYEDGFFDMVGVLPVPAPARISWGAWVCLIASRWRDFKVERVESNVIVPSFNLCHNNVYICLNIYIINYEKAES